MMKESIKRKIAFVLSIALIMSLMTFTGSAKSASYSQIEIKITDSSIYCVRLDFDKSVTVKSDKKTAANGEHFTITSSGFDGTNVKLFIYNAGIKDVLGCDTSGSAIDINVHSEDRWIRLKEQSSDKLTDYYYALTENGGILVITVTKSQTDIDGQPINGSPETTAHESIPDETKIPETVPPVTTGITLVEPALNATVNLHTKEQDDFIAKSLADYYSDYVAMAKFTQSIKPENDNDWSIPEPVNFKWTDSTGAKSYKVEISEFDDFSNAIVKTVNTTSLSLYNLKTGTVYYWRVNGSAPSKFMTKKGVRFLKIDGASNFRDVGGYDTLDGKTVRQGMIIRGTALDQKYSSFTDKVATESGIKAAAELGFKTDLDLRSSGEGSKPKGALLDYGVTLQRKSIQQYELVENSKSVINQIFKIFADKSSYPIYVHCQSGADRTGTLCFLLLGYLGVDEDTLLCDYELTSLSLVSTRSRHAYTGADKAKTFETFYKMFNDYPGSTVREKCTYFLKTKCGISQEILDEITEILIGSQTAPIIEPETQKQETKPETQKTETLPESAEPAERDETSKSPETEETSEHTDKRATETDAAEDYGFADVPSDKWYYSYVNKICARGIMKGTGNVEGKPAFSPDSDTKRCDFVLMLYRLEFGDEGTSIKGFSNPYTDVASKDYFYDAIAWATENKIINGIGNGKFGPKNSITREQIATILYNYTGIYKGLLTPLKGNTAKFADADKISSYAKNPLKWANGIGMLEGSGNYLNPFKPAKRSEISKIFELYMQKYVDEPSQTETKPVQTETKQIETEPQETEPLITLPPETEAPETPAEKPTGDATLLSPANGEEFELRTDKQIEFINLDRSGWDEETARKYYTTISSYPKTVTFKWSTTQKQSVLQIAENAAFSKGVITREVTGQSVSVINLKTGTTYYWRVNGSETRTFKTKAGTRFLKIDGVHNARDIGGYTTVDGKKVKQGLILRGSALDDPTKDSVYIRQAGIDYFVNDAKLKTDYDLRGMEPVKGYPDGVLAPYGIGIVKSSILSYSDLFSGKYDEWIRQAFDDVFSSRAALPVYVHCKAGADRTGCLCLLLEAVLGMKEEDILTDYEFTLMEWGMVWRNSEKFAPFWKTLNEETDGDLCQDAEHFLVEKCGVKPESITKIRQIMLEE